MGFENLVSKILFWKSF